MFISGYRPSFYLTSFKNSFFSNFLTEAQHIKHNNNGSLLILNNASQSFLHITEFILEAEMKF